MSKCYNDILFFVSRVARHSDRALGTIARPSPWRRSSCVKVLFASTSHRSSPKLQARHWTTREYATGFLLVAGLLSSTIYASRLWHVQAETPPATSDQSNRNLIRLAEVRKHCGNADRKWVLRGTRVYDITDWIPAHPGGDVILRAAGSSVDQFWDIFTIHKTQDVLDILEGYYIGDLDPRDLDSQGRVPVDAIEDPFGDDPERDARLLIRTPKPCNAETPPDALESWITPNNLFYVRHHLWVPSCDPKDPDSHTLTIELPNGEEKTYTVADLKHLFPPVTITATLQCSGNRRSHMSQNSRPTQGLAWNVGAISNAVWTGVRLRDVLAHAGFPVDPQIHGSPLNNGNHESSASADEVDSETAEANSRAKHVQFLGREAYGSSIPLSTAIAHDSDVLLAYAMNGSPLPPDHGAPLRALVPGTVAARSVKWLSRITLGEEESSSQWQRRDYKCFGPNRTKIGKGEESVWDEAPAIQEMPVQSAITHIRRHNGGSETSGHNELVEVQGYAYSGAGRKIIRVDVSADDGQTWEQAEILPPNLNLLGPRKNISSEENGSDSNGNGNGEWRGSKEWSWVQWRYRYPLPTHQPQRATNFADDTNLESGIKSKNLQQESNDAKPESITSNSRSSSSATPRTLKFVVKAVDCGYNCQPESYASQWNFRGNLTTAWHRVNFKIDSDGEGKVEG